jgi:hypothetical protein
MDRWTWNGGDPGVGLGKLRGGERVLHRFGNATGSRQVPLILPTGYKEEASRLARVELARAAGVRLAAVLNVPLQ